jgi:hypothetical protein
MDGNDDEPYVSIKDFQKGRTKHASGVKPVNSSSSNNNSHHARQQPVPASIQTSPFMISADDMKRSSRPPNNNNNKTNDSKNNSNRKQSRQKHYQEEDDEAEEDEEDEAEEEDKYGYKNALWLQKSRDIIEAVKDDKQVVKMFNERGEIHLEMLRSEALEESSRAMHRSGHPTSNTTSSSESQQQQQQQQLDAGGGGGGGLGRSEFGLHNNNNGNNGNSHMKTKAVYDEDEEDSHHNNISGIGNRQRKYNNRKDNNNDDDDGGDDGEEEEEEDDDDDNDDNDEEESSQVNPSSEFGRNMEEGSSRYAPAPAAAGEFAWENEIARNILNLYASKVMIEDGIEQAMKKRFEHTSASSSSPNAKSSVQSMMMRKADGELQPLSARLTPRGSKSGSGGGGGVVSKKIGSVQGKFDQPKNNFGTSTSSPTTEIPKKQQGAAATTAANNNKNSSKKKQSSSSSSSINAKKITIVAPRSTSTIWFTGSGSVAAEWTALQEGEEGQNLQAKLDAMEEVYENICSYSVMYQTNFNYDSIIHQHHHYHG